MLYAVTGGTGFLGECLVKNLVKEGHKVRVLVRSKPTVPFEGDVQFIFGSITDENKLEETFISVDGIFHLAGIVEQSRRRENNYFYDIFVNGTVKVLEKAKELGVRRVVYASTSGTVAVSQNSSFIATDSSPYEKKITENWPYYKYKIIAEEKALEFGKKTGLEIICMRPTLLLGPGDRRLSSCRSILDLIQKKVPFVPAGGLSYVDVRDVSKAFISAMSRGTPGETYLLGAENLTIENYFKRIEKFSGLPGPWLKISSSAAWAMAASVYGISGLFGRWDPSLDPVIVEMAQHFWYLDSTKAREELNFVPRDSSITLKETVEWLIQNKKDLID